MSSISSITLAAALAFGATASAQAQSSSQVQGQTPGATPAATAPAPSSATQPAPIVVETKVDLRSGGPQSPESAADARKEAQGELAEARAACRQEPSKEARNDCMRQARDDANALLNGARQRQ